MPESQTVQAAPQEQAEVGLDGSSLLKQLLEEHKDVRLGKNVGDSFPSLDPKESKQLEAGVAEFLKYVLRNESVISRDAIRTLDAIIEILDKKLTEQLNLIMHHPNFQAVEGTWRGLHYLVSKTITGPQLKIKVFDLSKDELADMMESYEGAAFDQSPLFKKIYSQGLGSANDEIFGCLTGDYYFDHSGKDVLTLTGISKICASAHCPFIAGAAPRMLGMESWTQLNDPDRLDSLQDNDFYKEWRSLRGSEDSRYIGLAMPRFVARYPYGAKTKPVKEFNFEEDTRAGDHSRYTWSNSAYAMAAGVTRAFFFDDFCTRIRGPEAGGKVGGLPAHTFLTDDRGIQTKCPTEVNIPQQREKELADLGYMPLQHFEGTDYAVFMGAQSIQQPKEYQGIDGKMATANANLSARLPYIFAVCRFAHFLNRIVYKNIGKFATRSELEGSLQAWIRNYVEARADATQEARAKRPLAGASVTVEEDESNRGYFGAKFKLAPHIQMEGLSVMLSLVGELPTGK